MGKTAFALNLVTHAAMSQDKAVALFELEMSAEQLVTRILSSVGQLEGFKLRTGNLLNNDWKRINEASAQLSTTNLVIDDTPGITIGEIRAKCRRLASSEKGLALVVIDYLQLISGGKNLGDRNIWFSILWLLVKRKIIPYSGGFNHGHFCFDRRR